MNPLAAATYVPEHLTPADLYGPFWTLTTLIFALFLSSSLAASISAYLGSQAEYDYDFKLLSIAMSLVYAYGLALPVLLWLALRYLGVGEWSVVEAISLWGYGQFVWIPVAVRRIYVYLFINLTGKPGTLRYPSPHRPMGSVRHCLRPLWLLPRHEHLSYPRFRELHSLS